MFLVVRIRAMRPRLDWAVTAAVVNEPAVVCQQVAQKHGID